MAAGQDPSQEINTKFFAGPWVKDGEHGKWEGPCYGTSIIAS